MERPELTVSTDTRQLPPMSRDCCSMLAEPAVRGQVTCPLATFGALVHITTAWSEGSDDDAREFSTDFREQFVEFSGREECLKRIQTSTKHADPLVRLELETAILRTIMCNVCLVRKSASPTMNMGSFWASDHP